MFEIGSIILLSVILICLILVIISYFLHDVFNKREIADKIMKVVISIFFTGGIIGLILLIIDMISFLIGRL